MALGSHAHDEDGVLVKKRPYSELLARAIHFGRSEGGQTGAPHNAFDRGVQKKVEVIEERTATAVKTNGS